MQEWEKKPIGEIAKVTSSKRIFLSDYVEEGVPFWRSKEVIEQYHGKNVSTELFIAFDKYEEIKNKFGVPRPGDILLTSVGTIGVPYLVRNESPFYFKDGNLTWIKDIHSEAEPYYIYLWLSSDIGQKEIQNNLIGSSQKALTIDSLKKIKIVLPPLPTQQKIAGILSAYDDLIENNLKRIKLLEEMAQITYEEWFVRMRFPGYESVSIDSTTCLPEGWKQLKCFDVMEVLSGGTPKTNTDKYWNGKIPFYTPKDAVEYSYVFETEKYVTELGVSKCNSKLYPKDTVFITARGTIGKVNLAGCLMAMNQSCYALRAKLGIPQYFLFFAIKSSIDGFKGASNGGVFNTIIVDTFRFLPFILPTHDLIYQFNDSVSPSLSEVSNLIRQNRLLREARDILLPRLMTGVIGVESYKPTDLLKEIS